LVLSTYEVTLIERGAIGYTEGSIVPGSYILYGEKAIVPDDVDGRQRTWRDDWKMKMSRRRERVMR
jgi:hypothetical protein